MKAKLIFKLPEDNDAHMVANDGHKFRAVLREVDNILREYVKEKTEYDKKRIKTPMDAFAYVRELIHEEMEFRHCSLDITL